MGAVQLGRDGGLGAPELLADLVGRQVLVVAEDEHCQLAGREGRQPGEQTRVVGRRTLSTRPTPALQRREVAGQQDAARVPLRVEPLAHLGPLRANPDQRHLRERDGVGLVVGEQSGQRQQPRHLCVEELGEPLTAPLCHDSSCRPHRLLCRV